MDLLLDGGGTGPGTAGYSVRVARRPARPALARVRSVGTALPPHYYSQTALLDACRAVWGDRGRHSRVEQFHRAVGVEGRHLALSVEETAALKTFAEANDAYVRRAVDLGSEAVSRALEEAGLTPKDVDHIFFVTITGIATPSIESRVANRLGFRPDVKRTPVFGLGCVAGAAGVARASDYLKAYPDHVAVLLSVELCSLTFQRADLSARNLIASGLFGDGAAAVVLDGQSGAGAGPQVLATRSVLYPDTEEVMGWNVTGDGFQIVLSADVPQVVRDHLRHDVESFLGDHGLSLSDIENWVCHPGGPKVLVALQETLGLPESALAVTWDSLRRVGNLSSASVLMVLGDTMRTCRPKPGTLGLMTGMGPGFCSELVLLRW